MFDPYHKWLGIPPGRRPPTLYQVLGVAPDEDDAEVIAEAALRQASHVRTYQTGPHAEQCIDVLNEIGRARATLLDPVKRKEYDATLAVVPTAPPPDEPAVDKPTPVGRDRWSVVWLLVYLLVLLAGGSLAFWLGTFQPGP